MRSFSNQQLIEELKLRRIKLRLIKELRPDLNSINDWDSREMVAVFTRSHNQGVLLFESADLFMVPFQISRGIGDKSTGRTKPITCDFCHTWQPGSDAARITFLSGNNTDHTFGFLCCADLLCSWHARNKTDASIASMKQLHENITVEQRIERLASNLQRIMSILEAA